MKTFFEIELYPHKRLPGRTKKKYEGGGSGEKMQKKSESRGMHGGKGGSSGSSSATNKIEIGAKLIDRDKNFVYSTIDSIFNDNILNSCLIDKGFLQVRMPDDNSIKNLMQHKTFEEYILALSKRSRRHIQKYALEYKEEILEVKLEKATPREVKHIHELYDNVKNVNYSVNNFKMPYEYFERLAADPNFIVWTFYLKENYHYFFF